MRKMLKLLPKGRKMHLLGVGPVIKLLPPAAFHYEIWSFCYKSGRILLENRYASDLVYGDAMELYRSFKNGNRALVRVFSDFQQIVKFRYEGSSEANGADKW